MLAQWRENQNSTSISQRDSKMAAERIKVIENFLLENNISEILRKKALGNSYYLAARLAFFDPEIKGKHLLLKAFLYRRGWPEEARLYVVVYILLMPFTSIIFKPFSKIIINTISYK